MHPVHVAAVIVGLSVLGPSIHWARAPSIPEWERRAFRAVNGLPAWLYWILWAPMQLGNLVVGTLAGLLAAWILDDWWLAVGVVAAAGLKLVGERLVRRWMASALTVRQRPGTSQPGAVLRGSDVPESGASFPSGHVILVAAVATVVGDQIPALSLPVPGLLVALVMLGRVYVGAHNPLDVTAGLGAGLVAGGLVDTLLP